MSEMLPVLNNISHGGSSGTGISFHKQASMCGRKSQLNRKMAESDEVQPYSFKAATGVHFHSYMEWYYGGGTEMIEVDDAQLDDAQVEAIRLFKAYKKRYGPQDFKRVVGVEVQLPPEGKGKEHTLMLAALHSMMGVNPFTARVDMVVELDDDAVERLSKKRPDIAHVLEPGIWLWDFKTTGQRDKSVAAKARLNPQFLGYQMAWNTCFPEQKCKGMISDWIVRHKNITDTSFYSAVTPEITERQEMAVRNWLVFARELHDRGQPLLTECTNYGICHYYESGLCDRV